MDSKKIKPILCVVTSCDTNGTSGVKTGFWLSELVHPLNEFRKAGIDFENVSILGKTPPIDPQSMDLSDKINAEFYNCPCFQKRLANTPAIDSVKASDYSAVFFAGGHGPM